jgi:hypothetical protein
MQEVINIAAQMVWLVISVVVGSRNITAAARELRNGFQSKAAPRS